MTRRSFLQSILTLSAYPQLLDITSQYLKGYNSAAPDGEVILKAIKDHCQFVKKHNVQIFQKMRLADWWAITMSICKTESNFNPKAVNENKYGKMIGLMQINYTYWSEKILKGRPKEFLFDPYWNIRVGLAIFSSDLARTGSIREALYAYVGGKNHSYVTRVLEDAFWLMGVAGYNNV